MGNDTAVPDSLREVFHKIIVEWLPNADGEYALIDQLLAASNDNKERQALEAARDELLDGHRDVRINASKALAIIRGALGVPSKPANRSEQLATQEFELHSILCNHCGERLTPVTIEKITEELLQAMCTGPCAWAFKESKHG